MLLTGGGTGGHITPILAVAHELKRLDSQCQTIYVGERHGKFAELTRDNPDIDESYSIFAGKFRRYHGESWLKRLFDLPTILKNIRDFFLVPIGLVQAWRLLGKLKPNIVFLKGGYVGVPIGLAAATRHIPIVTHDSDALPGLANRIVSRWANLHATALPPEFYSYPPDKVEAVGVLVEQNYQYVDNETELEFKHKLALPTDGLIVLITGGSSGARELNEVVANGIGSFLDEHTDVNVVHQVGKGKAGAYENKTHPRLKVLEFLNPMYQYMGAADIVVARASANTLAEIGIQGKACIAVPSAYLTGGHQLKNADRLKEQGAAIVVGGNELYDSQQGLFAQLAKLVDDKDLRKRLAENLKKLVIPDAAHRVAQILLDEKLR